jgi:hypothetical protein
VLPPKFPPKHNLILFGQPELLHHLAMQVNADLKSRITINSSLTALSTVNSLWLCLVVSASAYAVPRALAALVVVTPFVSISIIRFLICITRFCAQRLSTGHSPLSKHQHITLELSSKNSNVQSLSKKFGSMSGEGIIGMEVGLGIGGMFGA